MIDPKFHNIWHVFRRMLEQECDRDAALLPFELLGDSRVEIKSLAFRKTITFTADPGAKKIYYTSPEGDGFFRFDVLEDGSKLTDSRSQILLPPHEAAIDFVQRLMRLIVHASDPETSRILCGRADGLSLEPWPLAPFVRLPSKRSLSRMPHQAKPRDARSS
jgi:hypothetical protein